jgi:hypothetical protein
LEDLEERKLLSTYTLSESLSGGVPIVRETVDGVTTNFLNPASPFVFSTKFGPNTVDILDTSARIAVTVNSLGDDIVDVGSAGSVQGILATVTVQNPPRASALNVDDSVDATARIASLNTFVSGGQLWGSITGLAPAEIDYRYADTSSVSITTGRGSDTVNVRATGVPTGLSSGGGHDTINVGKAGSVQDILGPLSLQNGPNVDTVNIDDSADATPRTVVLSTFVADNFGWDSITGLAPVEIDYKDPDTINANITTGLGSDTVDVLALGVVTGLSSGGGNDTINVGNAGNLRGVIEPLTIQNPHGRDLLNVDDSADTVARTVNVSTFVAGAAPWGSIAGLAPAAINYKYADTAGVNLTTGFASDTVNVNGTGVPTGLSTSGGRDTVNVGSGGSAQGIGGVLTIQNPPSFDTINVDNLADGTGRAVTLSTIVIGGANFGSITGLAPAAIDYKYADASSVNIITGSGNDTVHVRATGVATSLSSSGGNDTVNVGDAGSVQSILSTLNIQNPPGSTALNVNDSTDAVARTATLSTFSSGGANWGTITGLAPAAINYKYMDTSDVNITLGLANDTVNVLTTGVPTSLSSNLGGDLINVGSAGSVQGIFATLTIQNPPSFDTINLDDSADTVARTVTLSTFVSGGANWGSITGLAPAAINYKYGDTAAVNLTTGHGNDTVNVRATGVATTLTSSGGNDTVNVGNAGSVQGIRGALTVQNPGDQAMVHVDDSADTTARTVTLSTFVSNGLFWNAITGLAPALIQYNAQFELWASVTTGSGADTVNVLGIDSLTELSTSGGNDAINVGNAGSVQGINDNLIISNLHGHDTINVNDSADATGAGWALDSSSLGSGSIEGPELGIIEYSLAGGSVNVTTGLGNDSVQVFGTGVPTNLSTSGGADTIEVGDNDQGVQDIRATLSIQNPPNFDTIIVNDAVDTVARIATLSTFAVGSVPFGSITGLAPATINYKYADTAGVTVETGLGSDTINVLATGTATTLTSFGGLDTVNVGNAGSVQGIIGTLTIENPPSFTTININDSADTTARVARLDTLSSAGQEFGTITGLAPAAIDFKVGDTSSPVSIATAVGRVSWIVSTNALASVTGVVVKDNGLQIN